MNWKVLLTRWIIAGSLLLALLTKSIDAKAVVTESRFSELATLPATTGVAQNTTRDYINIAKLWVKKYFPEYESYFNDIFLEISNIWWYELYLLNKKIGVDLDLSWDLLSNEKEIITVILVSLEMIIGKDNFKNWIWLSEDGNILIVAKDIRDDFIRTYSRMKEHLDNFLKEIEAVKTKGNSTNETTNEFITIIEKYMDLLKGFFLNYGYLKKSTGYQELVKEYIEMLKRTDRKPSQIWQRYIDAYNMIKKQ